MTRPSEAELIEALKPCPFCGGEAELLDFESVDGDPNAGGSCICCKRCGASSPVHFDRKENLVSSWNDRALTRAEGGKGEEPSKEELAALACEIGCGLVSECRSREIADAMLERFVIRRREALTAPSQPASANDVSLVERICRSVCDVEGIDPDEPIMDFISGACIEVPTDPRWTRYAQAVCDALGDRHEHRLD
ncbi:MAG: Lar family restriction alleviation protein [Rhizobiales bacterium]|nr:Lar family restriction alleviation protein [Hyphomicrobiales bacterium]